MRRPQRFNSEASLHEQACDYLRLKYGWAIFRTDYAAGLKLTMGQAIRHKRLQSGRAWPDLLIVERSPYLNDGKVDYYSGLFIELKREGTTIRRKDGELVADKHIREQAEMLEALERRGFKAVFACGFDEFKAVVDDYFEGAAMPF